MNEVDLSLKHSTTESSQIGEKLRYARESKGLSQQEVARALCLSVPVIDALERNAYEELPAPVFIKGYLKNYADFLRLPLSAEDLQIKATANPAHSYAHQKPRQSSTLSIFSLVAYVSIKLLNYLVFPLLLLLVFFWWHENHHATEKVISMTSKANLTGSPENPFPRIHSRPIPPDITPWLDDAGGAQ